MGMFDFFSMVDSYEDRVVANFKQGDLVIDTAAVTDSDQPYETGIKHPAYNGGKWVIVELYDTKNESLVGHENWVKLMTAEKLPTTLKDVSTAGIVKLGKVLDVDLNEIYKRGKPKPQNGPE